ncbi:MAG: NAD(P)/FAD-dependent oxidoreductase [Alphaproteobacteria bacterium]|nr:NAD(P)/FAD-dependent oxidoreductase [Alphaproteobacteria bacterium]
MTEPQCIDVLVVGLGPAGASAARAAQEAGWRVIAIDRRRSAGLPVQCAEFVPSALSQELNGLEAVTRQRISSMFTYVEDASPNERDRFPGRIIDRDAFDAALVESAEKAGAACRFRTALRALTADASAVLSDGSVIRAKVVVGADGPRSRVGDAVGRVNRDLVETRQITVPLVERHGATDIFLSAEIPGGYGWLFPKGRVANLGVGVVPWAKGQLKPLLDALHARLVEEGRVGKELLAHTGGLIAVGGALDPVARLGEIPVLLAGDAAGLTNPVTGAGIAAAVLSGDMAGRAAADWLAGDAAALSDYREEVEALFGGALDRAVRRRREILQSYRDGAAPTPAALRRGWIAYPEYWAA